MLLSRGVISIGKLGGNPEGNSAAAYTEGSGLMLSRSPSKTLNYVTSE